MTKPERKANHFSKWEKGSTVSMMNSSVSAWQMLKKYEHIEKLRERKRHFEHVE